jgi:hypothetical protein
MFMSSQFSTRGPEHLVACHWYIEMPIGSTPPHEEKNRRSLEPSFKTPEVVPIQTSKGGPSSNIGGRKGKPRTKNAVAHTALSWEDGSTRSSKRAPPPSSIDTTKKMKRDDDQVSRPDHDEVNQGHSENRSSRLHSQTTRDNDFGGR